MASLFHKLQRLIVLASLCVAATAIPAFAGQGTIAAQIAPATRSATYNCETLPSRLAEMWRSDSNHVYRLADECLACSPENDTAEGGIVTQDAMAIMHMYEIGLRNDQGHRADWLTKRAALGMRCPHIFASTWRRWAVPAVQEVPDEVSCYGMQRVLDVLIGSYASKRTSQQDIVEAWAMVDRLLLLGELRGGEEAANDALWRESLRLKMRGILPDCGKVMTLFSDGIAAKSLPPSECETFLRLYDLQGCDAAALWESAMATALAAADQAWLRRLAGAQAFNAGEWGLARSHWQRAVDLEHEDRLKAVDLLQIAHCWLAERDFRSARSSIQAAMQHLPTWGEPYIQLMNLYLEGNKTCKTSAFAQKAIYWLLMNLCRELINVDSNYATQANERLYEYAKLAPTAEEAAFIGFRPGDTYPFKCWMSATTIVPGK